MGEDHDVLALARSEIDVANLDASESFLNRHLAKCWSTARVNQRRSLRDSTEEAEVVNARAPGAMAKAAAAKGARFIHFSTDYVFDGTNHAL